jgi:AraC-like DNA-binding protein
MAIESVRTRPTRKTIFPHAKIVGLMSGRLRVTTATGAAELEAGDVFVLGSGLWCALRPAEPIRTWTIHLDETFLRCYTMWALPPAERLQPGTHPADWDGGMRVFHPGAATLARIEPLMRQISVADRSSHAELMRSMAVRHFAEAVELMIPALLDDSVDRSERCDRGPVVGRLSAAPIRSDAARAAELLRSRMAEPWTLSRLAAEVSVSASYLPEMFRLTFGTPPIRYLNEIRLTSFVRLLEETDLPIALAANKVGWRDSRIASARFRRRYGLSPSAYRARPQRFHEDESP